MRFERDFLKHAGGKENAGGERQTESDGYNTYCISGDRIIKRHSHRV